MKKFLLPLAILAVVAVGAVSCDKSDESDDNYKLEVLTFEDVDYSAGSSYWSSHIDSESSGSLIYSTAKQYSWIDIWTNLSGVVNEAANYYTGEPEWQFSSGGIVISNYYHAVELGTEVTFENQLSVSNGTTGAAGNNGSANFAIVYDAKSSGWGYAPQLAFNDGIARTIDHLYISSTSYSEAVALNGNDWSSPLGDESYFHIVATGYDAEGKQISTSTYKLAENGAMVSGWNKWDLSSLGNVAMVEFSITSDIMEYGGITIPTYFAIDDIAVVVE